MSLFAILGLNMEMAIVLLVALLLFGNRLPSVMRSLGQSVTEFKKGMESPPDDDAAVKGESAKKLAESPPNDDAAMKGEVAKKLDDQPVKS